MSLKQFTEEQISEMSLIEIAHELLLEKKQAVSFKELADEIASIKNLSEDEIKSKISQFYTDMNVDGRYLCVGENRWGLRVWYPVDQVEEEVIPTVKTKKKKAKKAVEEDLEIEDFDEIDEEELDYDDFDEDEEEDLLDDDDDDDVVDDADLVDDDVVEDDDGLEIDEVDEDLELDDEDEDLEDDLDLDEENED